MKGLGNMGLSVEEVAFYDALADNHSGKDMGDDTLKMIASHLELGGWVSPSVSPHPNQPNIEARDRRQPSCCRLHNYHRPKSPLNHRI